MEFENGFPSDDIYSPEYVDEGDLSPDVDWEWEQSARIQDEQDVEDLLTEMMVDWHEQHEMKSC